MVARTDTLHPITSPVLRANNTAILSNGQPWIIGKTDWFANFAPSVSAEARIQYNHPPSPGTPGAPVGGEPPLWLAADLLRKYFDIPSGIQDVQLVATVTTMPGSYRIGLSPDEMMDDRHAWFTLRRDPNIIFDWDPVKGKGAMELVTPETCKWFTDHLTEHPRHCHFSLLLDHATALPTRGPAPESGPESNPNPRPYTEIHPSHPSRPSHP
jgi:hypothetical protein